METENKYWHTLQEWIIEVVKFLAEQDLSFHGSDETVGSPHNGNFLGLLELLAMFDPFVAEHINTHVNKGRWYTSCLSKTICEEFINLIGSSILDHITIWCEEIQVLFCLIGFYSTYIKCGPADFYRVLCFTIWTSWKICEVFGYGRS